MTNRDNEGIAHAIIEATLPIAHEFRAYAKLLKAMTTALDEAWRAGLKQGQETEASDDT